MDMDLTALISELKKKEAIEVTEQRLNAGEDPLKILEDGKKAMQIVGKRFSEGTYFIPDLVFSGKILEQIAEMVKPALSQAPCASVLKVSASLALESPKANRRR